MNLEDSIKAKLYMKFYDDNRKLYKENSKEYSSKCWEYIKQQYERIKLNPKLLQGLT